MKRILSSVLCLALIVALLPLQASAAPTFSIGYDYDICAGGIYDAWVNSSQDVSGATYQWQFDASMGDGSWYDLDDSSGTYGYKGTKTDHFQFVTQYKDNSYEIGTGWEDIPFRCKITLDGKTYYTNSFCMNIYGTGTFRTEIKKLGAEFTTCTWRNVSYREVSEGLYTGTSVAGKTLEFIVTCPQPVGNCLLQRSDVRLIPEIYVTENGKITKGVGSISYTPSAVGAGAVVVEYKLRVMLGATDMGIYDSNKMVIETLLPANRTPAIAKQDMHLLKEMYTQSTRLVAIPKNATVTVHETIGGTWYKASYGGFIGYVPVSSLSLDNTKLIQAVDITIEEPMIGNHPQYNPPVNTEGCELYLIEPVTWLDKNTNEFMKPGEKFQEGHAYRLCIWVSAKDGYAFAVDPYDNIQTLGRINGKRVNVHKAYEQIPEQVIELTLDYGILVEIHTCKLVLVNRVEPTCTRDGKEAYFYCSCGMYYADGRAQQPIRDLNSWGIIPALGHKESPWRYNEFVHYKACITCGEHLEDEPHRGGTATCVDRPQCEVCGCAYGSTDSEHRWGPGWDYKVDMGHGYVCADCKTHSEIYPHKPGPEATDTSPQICMECDYILVPAKNHKHELTLVPAKDATCMEPGNIAYYVCSGCSDRFTDDKGLSRIPDAMDVTTGALGHTLADKWNNDSNYHWRICQVCNTVLDETKMYHDMISGRCMTCGYMDGAAVPTDPEPSVPNQTEEPHEDIREDGQRIDSQKLVLYIILIAVVFFGLSVTITAILLKKKRK